MGKIRVKSFGDQEEEKKQERKKQARKEAKLAEKKAEVEEVKTEEPVVEAPSEPQEAVETKEVKKKEKREQKEQEAYHSQKYLGFAQLVDKSKIYSLADALETLEKLQRKSFDETVELHLNTTSIGLSGNISLPNGTGKKTRVAIADDKLIAEVEKGVISFDILVAEPSMMAKLARVAKVLGPRGLMPNPKNGTITEKPEEVAKKYEGGQVNFKTEAKSPIMHLTVGKMSFGKEKLSQNVEALVSAIKKQNIVNATIKSTMSPGLKIKI